MLSVGMAASVRWQKLLCSSPWHMQRHRHMLKPHTRTCACSGKGWRSWGLGGVCKSNGVMLGSSSLEGGVTVYSTFPGLYSANASQISVLHQETLCRGLAICAWPSASTWPTAVHLSHRLLCPDLQLTPAIHQQLEWAVMPCYICAHNMPNETQVYLKIKLCCKILSALI